jgi:hypothetical protein
MTQNIDPFAQADGSTSINPNAGDPFSQPSGGGSYLKPVDLFGALILLTPIKIEEVKDNFDKGADPKLVERLTADTVVLDGVHAGKEFDAMWWSNAPIVGSGKAALERRSGAILGRLFRFPIGEDKKAGKYQTPADIEAALTAWRPGMPNVRFSWKLAPFNPEDAQVARAYLASKQPVSPFGA